MQKYDNAHNVPLIAAVWLAHDDYDYNPEPYSISASTLLKSVRKIILGNRVDPANNALADISDFTDSRIGQTVHSGIEHAWKDPVIRGKSLESLGYPAHINELIVINPPTGTDLTDKIPVYIEQRASRKVGKWTVSGKTDFIFDGVVTDIKSTKVFKYINRSSDEEYQLQTSIYGWLNEDKVTADTIDICFIFKDFSKGSIWQKGYPPHNPLAYTLPSMSPQAVQSYVQAKLDLIEKLWDVPDHELPHCVPSELWQKGSTFKYYKNPANKKRSTANFDNLQEAQTRFYKDGQVGEVVEVPDKAKACNYCEAKSICQQRVQLIAAGMADDV